jgi:hypothetical protein
VNDACFFDVIATWLGSPLLKGRSQLPRQQWPTLFENSLNSWSEYVCRILHLVELALLSAEQESRREGYVPSSLVEQSQSAKRRARKKALNQRLRCELQQDIIGDLCPVCDGSRTLLGDPCPLCNEDLDNEEMCNMVQPVQSHGDKADANALYDIEVGATDKSVWLSLEWSSGWEPFDTDSHWAIGEKWYVNNSSKRGDPCEAGHVSSLRASIKNTFLHVAVVGAPPQPVRSRSLPSLLARVH